MTTNDAGTAPALPYVRLIAISRPAVPDVPDAAALLAYCARVSSAANQGNHETGGRLLRSLVRRQEWSPLEMVSLTMEIGTTRDIARQILRHRSFSFQEFSQRYAVVEEHPHFRTARLQHPTDRQRSLPISLSHGSDADIAVASRWNDAQRAVAEVAFGAYRDAIAAGVAKEVARAILPEGLTPSRLYMAGTLRSWVHYVSLRTEVATQLEHRMVATRCRDIIVREFPDLADLLPATGGVVGAVDSKVGEGAR